MTINHTLNHLLASRSTNLLNFSAQVTTASTYLKCSGGEAGDGLPMPSGGRIVGLQVWDGLTLNSGSGEISFTAGARISLYAQYNAPTFDVKVRIDGLDTTLVATGVAANSTLMASVKIILE